MGLHENEHVRLYGEKMWPLQSFIHPNAFCGENSIFQIKFLNEKKTFFTLGYSKSLLI